MASSTVTTNSSDEVVPVTFIDVRNSLVLQVLLARLPKFPAQINLDALFAEAETVANAFVNRYGPNV